MPFGPLEIVIVLIVILLVFGAKKLPEMGRSLGSGMREFRDGVSGRDDEPAAKAKASSASSEPASLQKAPQDDPSASTAARATTPAGAEAEETVDAEPVHDGERGRTSAS